MNEYRGMQVPWVPFQGLEGYIGLKVWDLNSATRGEKCSLAPRFSGLGHKHYTCKLSMVVPRSPISPTNIPVLCGPPQKGYPSFGEK